MKENKEEKISEEEKNVEEQQHNAPNISEMKATTKNAYGGGMYAPEKASENMSRPPASDTQSADGPVEARLKPKHQPPSSGDRDIDITSQSYIQ
ncbi:hypothetical protein RND81_03G013600 [Saponaria officinalis]|uniref:Uncharacterized protein n=1 Tax=Saponaria officinalis TaxID=3572 RepID=A0AAW1M6N4_SAPOF